MKIIVLLSVLATALAYSDIDDTFDLDSVVKNPVELKKYVDCALDRGPCEGIMKIAKSHMFEAFSDSCKECDDIQKHMLRTFLKGIIDTYPNDAEEFKKKYDSDGTHFAALQAEISKY